VSARIEDVGHAYSQRHPQVSLQIRGSGIHRGQHERNEPGIGLVPRPGRRQVLDESIELRPLDVALEQQRACRIVLAELRHAGKEDEVEAP